MKTVKELLKSILSPLKDTSSILTLNCGSSSIKLSLFSLDNSEKVLDAILIKKPPESLDLRAKEHKSLHPFPFDLIAFLQLLTEEGICLKGIGHRYVHGGSSYSVPILANKEVMDQLHKLNPLAPLHNPLCYQGVKSCLQIFGPTIAQVLIFDTAFHHTIPDVAARYAIPSSLTEKYEIRRYGFHGISHAFLIDTYRENTKTNFQESKIITIHLGHGCSMAAIKGGVSIDTSMGFTPTEGLIMATRCGDLDPGIFAFLCDHEHVQPSDLLEILNHQSGILGVSQISDRMEELESHYEKSPEAKLAIDMFCYHILKYIGAYTALLGGVDAVLFSGGIGENAPRIRSRILQPLSHFGIQLDESANQQTVALKSGQIQTISSSESKVSVNVIATDENRYIFEHTLQFLNLSRQ